MTTRIIQGDALEVRIREDMPLFAGGQDNE
jgi:hypothetical protein